jgi:hypothetical protein
LGKAEHRIQLARAFEHKQMSAASERQKIKSKGAPKGSIESYVFKVAYNFVQLQQKRELADYDSSIGLSIDQARGALREAEEAFSSWEVIRNEPAAHDYLFSLLIREKPGRAPEWG